MESLKTPNDCTDNNKNNSNQEVKTAVQRDIHSNNMTYPKTRLKSHRRLRESRLIKGLTEESPEKDYSKTGNLTTKKPAVDDEANILIYINLLNDDINFKLSLTEPTHRKVKGNYSLIIRTQTGSRILQKLMSTTSQEILSDMLTEIKPDLADLMGEKYPNYFCQRFFACLSSANKLKFLSFIGDEIINLSKSKIGTFSLQRLVDYLEFQDEKNAFISYFSRMSVDTLKDMCCDSQAVHVIEKLLTFKENTIEFIVELILENFLEFSHNPNSLCLTKKLILNKENPIARNSAYNLVVSHVLDLMNSQYGNYLVQTALENWSIDELKPIFESFYGNFFQMSMTKYASNAIEKCLEKFPDYLTSIFIDEILIGQKLLELMRNNFGNYVIQKALKTAKGNSKEKLLSAIKKNIEKLNDIKLVTKWNQILDISELKIMPEFHSMPINNPAYINNPNDLAQCMNFNMINMNNMQGFQRNNLNLLDPYRMPNSPCLRPLSYNSMLPLKMMQGSPRSMNIPYDNNFPTGSSLQSRSNKLSSNTSLRSCNIESSQLNLQSMVFGQLGQLDHSMFNSGNMQGGRQNPQIRNHHYSNEFADFDSGINGIANLQPMQHMPNNKTYNLDKGMFKDDSDMKNNHSINSNKVEPISESSIESSGMSKENSSSPVKRAKKYTIKILPENNK